MKKALILFIATLSMVLFVNTAYCTLVTGQFSGIITSVSDPGGVLNGSNITANSSTFTGTFSYDTSTSPKTSSQTWAIYSGANLSITIDSTYDLFPNNNSCQIETYNDDWMAGDEIIFREYSYSDSFPDNEKYKHITLYMQDTSMTAFSDISLPFALDLADFGFTGISISGATNDNRYYDISGDITSLSTIIEPRLSTIATPIPGAVWLLASGLAVLIGHRRKFKK